MRRDEQRQMCQRCGLKRATCTSFLAGRNGYYALARCWGCWLAAWNEGHQS